jgi:hypothetical protein
MQLLSLFVDLEDQISLSLIGNRTYRASRVSENGFEKVHTYQPMGGGVFRGNLSISIGRYSNLQINYSKVFKGDLTYYDLSCN